MKETSSTHIFQTKAEVWQEKFFQLFGKKKKKAEMAIYYVANLPHRDEPRALP